MNAKALLDSYSICYRLGEYLGDHTILESAMKFSSDSNSPLWKSVEFIDGLMLPDKSLIKLRSEDLSILPDASFHVRHYGPSVGWGVESTVVIPKHTKLFPYYGEFIGTVETERRHTHNKRLKSMNYILTIREHIPPSNDHKGGVLVSNIDGQNKGNIARFVNHSCCPNCKIIMIREKSSVLGIPVLVTIRGIAPGEQITFNYGHNEVTEPAEEEKIFGDTSLGKRQRPKSSTSSPVHDPDAITPTPAFEEKNITDSTSKKLNLNRGGTSSLSNTTQQDDAWNRKICFCGANVCSGFLPIMVE